MKTIEVIYSPVCEASMAFLGMLREWMAGTAVEIIACPYDPASARQNALFLENGQRMHGRMVESCFIDVYHMGKRIDSVPLNRQRICSALGIAMEAAAAQTPPPAPESVSAERFRAADHDRAIEWIAITRDTCRDEMTMCLHNYPHGNPPERFHAQCMERKLRVFEEVWEKETCAGLYARMGQRVIGLLEIFPREVLKAHGFMTGSRGDDAQVLTVGCYEVGAGMPRIEVIDALMRQLEGLHGRFARRILEGIGVFEWPDGFTPYWVYDKYGFHVQERMADNKVVMWKHLP